MKRFRTVEPIVYILGIAGGALFIGLLVREGAQQVGSAIARAGWGLLAITLFHLVQTLSDSAGWLVLIPKQNRVRLTSSFLLHWLGESINNLLPTGRVGGDIVVARVASIWGMPLRIATAAMVVDITIGVERRPSTAGRRRKILDLGIAEKTIKMHRARVMEKMGATSLADLLAMAARIGIHTPL